ncbi:hypothetical protein [Enterococcus rivorum]|uniref:hypothetical protein n=1 Tax=Enterococcus rivorum TaxID=762845 RepID=UPI001B808A27|nr:hypothetical protein [Enterococcus rivorum]
MNWQKKKKLRQVFICLLCCSVSTGTAFYLRYYQATNLGARDSEAVAQGYYLINKIEEQLDADVNEEDTSRVQKNIYELSAKLSSFGTTTADGALSKQGQILLNRFYVNMKELGLNLSNHSSAVLESEELYTNYKEDIKKTRNNQKKVFDYFKLNESSFEKSK